MKTLKGNTIKHVITLSILLIFSFLISGCADQPKPLYIYGNYSQSYYTYKNKPSIKSKQSLEKSIKYAINHSNKSSSKRVAPGMYANLGYIYLKSGNRSKAIENFEKEKLIYPESTFLMDKMIKEIEEIK